jgi:dCTP diphosphatase
VKGQAHKYDHYSAQTGIKKEGQSIGSVFQTPPWDGKVSLSGLQATLREFVAERDWAKYHAPRNLLLALVGEMGELCEIVKTGRGGPAAWPRVSKDELAQEVADVFIYLLRFCDVCNVDLRQGLEEVVATRQMASRKQGWRSGEEKEGEKKEKGFAHSTYLLTAVATACVVAVLYQKR